ncbi:MAG: LysR substrate-binding domain-containing protein, partial [Myxococcota bacterium]
TAAGFGRVVYRTNSFLAQLDAVRAGLGVAALPRVAAEGLVEMFAGLTLPGVDVFLVTRPAAVRQPHIRAFIDALNNTFDQNFPPEVCG